MSEKIGNDKIDRPKTWRRSIEKDGVTKSLSVREIENGFIVCYNKYGTDPETEKYIDITKEFFSKENPLAKKGDSEEALLDDMKDLMSFNIENYL